MPSLTANSLPDADTMAVLRLLARDSDAVALVPAVVVIDELRSGVLEEYAVVPTLYVEFYAISVKRQYQHPLVAGLLERAVGAELAVWR